MEDFIRNYKVYVITLVVVIVLFFILSILNLLNKNDTSKEFKHSDYIKTIDTVDNKDEKSKLPYINIKSNEVKKINNQISELFYDITNYETNSFTYEYFVNDDIVSLLIKIKKIDEMNVLLMNESYISYNIDIKNKKQISKDELLSKYNVTYDTINNMIDERMRNFYNFEIENGYIDEECDYEGYLGWRNITLPTNDIALIVDNKTIEEYLLTEKIKFSKIVKEQDEINKKEITYINGASNEDDFNDIRRFLKKNNLNKNICMVDVSNHFA